jgi:hypothetical protein
MEGGMIHGKQCKDKDAVDRVNHLRQASIDGWAEANQRTREVRRYVCHKPYTERELALAAQNNKPTLRYNMIVSKVTTLLGQEQANRRATKIIADFAQNQEVAEILQANWEYVREQQDLQRKRGRLLVDGLFYQKGGYIRRVIERDDRGHLGFAYRMYEPLSVHPDSTFKELDMSDCRYVCFDDWMTIDQIRQTFGADVFSSEEEAQAWELVDGTISADTFGNGMKDEYKRGDEYLVVQCEQVVQQQAYLVMYEGSVVKLVADELKQLDKAKEQYTVLDKTTDKRVHLTTIIPGTDDVVLQDVDLAIPSRKVSCFYCGSYDFNMPRSEIPSLGYYLIDPQDRLNKGKNQEVDHLMQVLSQLWFFDQRDKTAREQFLRQRGNPVIALEVSNLRNKPQKEGNVGDGGAIQTIQNAIQQDNFFIDEVSNVTDAMQGKRGNSSESGVLFNQKVTQSQKSTNPFYEMIAAVDEYLTRDFLECVPWVYFEQDRALPVKMQPSGELGYEMVNLNVNGGTIRDLRQFAGRAVLEDAASTPNRIEEAFNQNIALVQMMINSGFNAEQIPWDLIIAHSPLRDRDKWTKRLQQAQQQLAEQNANAEAMNEFSQMATLAQQVANQEPTEETG